MNTFQHLRGILAMLFLVALVSCGPEYVPTPEIPKSSEKVITSFTFPGLFDGVNTIDVKATITETSITAVVPRITDLTKLAPIIAVSPSANVSPAYGTPQDFTKPVTYTVTAQNGTTQSYTVSVTHSDFKITGYYSKNVDRAASIIVMGSNFGPRARIKLVLRNTATNAITELPAELYYYADQVFFLTDTEYPLGNYACTFYDGTDHQDIPETVNIIMPNPYIKSVSSNTVVQGGTITIIGENFETTGNIITATDMSNQYGNTVSVDIVSESRRSITIRFPETTPERPYKIDIKTSRGQVSIGYTINVTAK